MHCQLQHVEIIKKNWIVDYFLFLVSFKLYDRDQDGFISKSDMLVIVDSIYKMMGTMLQLEEDVNTPDKRVNKIFENMDLDKDDRLSLNEFRNGSMNDSLIANTLSLYEGII